MDDKIILEEIKMVFRALKIQSVISNRYASRFHELALKRTKLAGEKASNCSYIASIPTYREPYSEFSGPSKVQSIPCPYCLGYKKVPVYDEKEIISKFITLDKCQICGGSGTAKMNFYAT